MSLVDRVKNICLTPNTEWSVIAAEPASVGGLMAGYVAPLISAGVVAGFIGGSVVGRSVLFVGGTYRTPLVTGVSLGIFAFVMGIVSVFILSLIINALAPTFGGQKDGIQALKVAAYSYTPGWLAGVLQVLPSLGALAGLVGGLYGLYLLYLGLPTLMKSPKEKAAGYAVVVVVCAIVLSLAAASVGALVIGAGAIGSGSAGSGIFGGTTALGSPSGEVEFDKDSSLGKLQQLGKAMEESNKQMDAAQKSGDPNAQAAAAMNSLGTLLGGGRKVDPLDPDALRPFIPTTFAGLAREGAGTAEKAGMPGLMLSRAEGRYGQSGSKTATLEVSDSGGVSGLVGLASWAGLQTSTADDDGSEKTTKVGSRMVHEKRSKSGGDEYSIVIGERFMVTARSRDVSVDELRTAVGALDLGKLESLKDVGVQK